MHDGRALCLYAIYVFNFSKNGFVFDPNLDLSFYDHRISSSLLLLSCTVPISFKYTYYITFKYDHLRQKYFMFLTIVYNNVKILFLELYFYGLKHVLDYIR